MPKCLSTCGGVERGVCGCVPKPGGAFDGSVDFPHRYGGDPVMACSGSEVEQGCYCRTGFLGTNCDVTCPVANGSTALSCGGPQQGRCTTSATTNSSDAVHLYCSCLDGWEGDDCTVASCPGVVVVMGPSGYATPRPCSNRGECRRTTALVIDTTNSSGTTQVAQCQCNDGFTGGGCEDLDCPTAREDQVCSGYGTCEVNDAGTGVVCNCVYGWDGADCNTNAGLQSLIWSLSVGLGLLLVVVAVGMVLYFMRNKAAGRFVGPGDSLRRRRWTRADRASRAFETVAVHVPQRPSAKKIGPMPQPARTRIDPTLG
jgi:hypothetical protein